MERMKTKTWWLLLAQRTLASWVYKAHLGSRLMMMVSDKQEEEELSVMTPEL